MHSGTDETCVTVCFLCFRCTVEQMRLVWQCVSYVLDAQWHRWDLCDCLCFRCTVAQMKLVWQFVCSVLDAQWHRWDLCDSLFCFRCTVAYMRLVWQFASSVFRCSVKDVSCVTVCFYTKKVYVITAEWNTDHRDHSDVTAAKCIPTGQSSVDTTKPVRMASLCAAAISAMPDSSINTTCSAIWKTHTTMLTQCWFNGLPTLQTYFSCLLGHCDIVFTSSTRVLLWLLRPTCF